ncbi:AAA family ATPase [Phenylobacterium sp. LjRoot225]|uniref:UvrD-helicase domain-containing protein n=1 Tax=Phenylobacterium sp. LjRoot225 TaxID=3342285 RepID=UPI003ECDD699
MADAESDIADVVVTLPLASVIAAAGCGKTEQIMKAAQHGGGRRLLLTHTHAGVDALRARLKDKGVAANSFHIDTIAGWCLRYAAAFPLRSGLAVAEPRSSRDWDAVYAAALRLLKSGAVDRVLTASYCGLLVDEYQDCGGAQHQVVEAISAVLPTCVFGDPLQAIFDFNGQKPVDWQGEVFPRFPLAGTLTKPWRWVKSNNSDMADWLAKTRPILEAGGSLDFGTVPACVKWASLPTSPGMRQGKIIATCLTVMSRPGRLVLIDDPVNLNGRALMAKKLAKRGFSNIEPVDCKSVFSAAKKLEALGGSQRLNATMDFLSACVSDVGSKDFVKAVESRKIGGKLGTTRFGALITLGVALGQSATDADCLALIEAFSVRAGVHVFRREMLFAMKSALKMRIAGEATTLADALWHVQNRVRHAGRYIPHRSVGSTLLVKGLEFEHAVVVYSPNMSVRDWYVALTRATQTLTVLSPQRAFVPPA